MLMLRALALTLFLTPFVAAAAPTPYILELGEDGGNCNPLNPPVSCVRFDGNTEEYPPGTELTMFADFDNPIGSAVPLTFPDFFVPTVPRAAADPVVTTVPMTPTGSWDLITGEITINIESLEFANVIDGTAFLDDFSMTTGSNPEVQCDQIIPDTFGEPLNPPNLPGDLTVIGTDCVTDAGLFEAFFIVLVGTVVPEPGAVGACAAVFGSLCALGRSRRRRPPR